MLKRYKHKGMAKAFLPELADYKVGPERMVVVIPAVIVGISMLGWAMSIGHKRPKKWHEYVAVKVMVHKKRFELHQELEKKLEVKPKKEKVFDAKELKPKRVVKRKKRIKKIRHIRHLRRMTGKTTKKKVVKKTVKPVFGLSKNSVAKNGQGAKVSIRVGNTLMKAPDKNFTPPDKVKPLEGEDDKQSLDGVYEEDLVSRPPRFIKKVMPEYPEEAEEDEIEGLVIVTAIVGKDGHVEKIEKVVGPDPSLKRAAVRALLRSRFLPALYKGRPVKCRVKVPYNFRLQ